MALGTNGIALYDEILYYTIPELSYIRFNISAGDKWRYNEIMRPRDPEAFNKVIRNVIYAVWMKQSRKLSCSVGLQMVLMPEFADQIIPLSKLAVELGVDYLVIKHCSDDEHGSLGVDYAKYAGLEETLREAERLSTASTKIIVKWSKIREGNIRSYQRCYGPPLHIQLSGSGLVAPCGMLFGEKYKGFHIGNITETRFRDIWESERYWEVMRYLASPEFNAQTMCGCLCLQHSTNKALDNYEKTGELPEVPENVEHKEFL